MEIIKKENPLPSLSFCLLMDAVGCISYVIPAFMEITDLIWAPISAFIFYKTFGGKVGQIGAVINFVEEVVPFADIVPSFTIAWLYTKYRTTIFNK